MTPKELAAAYGFTPRTLRNKLRNYAPLFSKHGNKTRKRYFSPDELAFIKTILGDYITEHKGNKRE